MMHEGPMIQALCQSKQLDIARWTDWTQPLAANWLLAETDQVWGCVMVQYGAPFGRMEFMVVRPDTPHRLKAIVVRNLTYAGMEALKRHGSQIVSVNIDDHAKEWQRVVERRGAVKTGSGNFYMKKVN